MVDNELDILSIDAKIKLTFEDELKNLPEYKHRLAELKRTVKNNFLVRAKNDLECNIKQLENRIDKIENGAEKNFYIAETAQYIEQYKKILKTPIKMSFMGKKTANSKDKMNIVRKYATVAQKYIDITIEEEEKKTKIVCETCPNGKNFDIVDENIYICKDCGTQREVLLHSTSYKDIDRVNISTKYSYDRKVHFRDCINQYQGKQNSTIDQKVYDALEDQFERHHLLIGDKDTEKEIRFSKITKDHIAMFLKELSYTKHYENVNLIHYNFTGIKPDDISRLEDKLLNDFDVLTETYDTLFKNKIERTNFINTQYVLFQLLQRHKHPCKREDFVMLKTVDRQSFHDKVTAVCFQHLGWNHYPSF